MKRKLLLPLAVAVLLLLTVVPAGCQGGIAQEAYDQVTAQLQEAQSEINEAQEELAVAQAEKDEMEAELEATRAEIARLENQVGGLQDQYELVGDSKADTAARIVRNYHDTHVYSTTDMFICGDMSSEVWNMLKAQGIDSVIAIGNKDNAVSDILQSNHAWVLAEVGPGEKLALETTNGSVVTRAENPLYYQGWTFDSPAKLKDNNKLVREYNVRVAIHNDIVAEAQQVADEYNKAASQVEADKKKAVYDELAEIIEAQEAEMEQIESRINGLATRIP